MDLFTVFNVVCLVFLAVNLVYLLFASKNKTARNSIRINSLFFAFLSCLSVWQAGIYADEYGLSGSSVAFILNLICILLLVVIQTICLLSSRKKRNDV